MSQFAQQAEQLITAQKDQTEQLLNLLKQEYDLLKNRQVDTLEALSADKQVIVNTLEQMNQTWQSTLREHNIKIDLAEITKALQNADNNASQGLFQSWQTLSELAKACQRQNQINGAVLVLRQQVTQQTIDLLRGQTNEGTYDTNGQRKPGGEGHSLAKA